MDVKSLVIVVIVLIIGIIVVYELANAAMGGFISGDVPAGNGFVQATLRPTAYPTPPALANITPETAPGKVKLSGTVYVNGKPSKSYTEIEEFRFVPATGSPQRFIVGYTEGVYEMYAFESPVTDRFSYVGKASVNKNGGYEITVPAGMPLYIGLEYVRESHFVNNDYTSSPEPDLVRMYYAKADPFVVNASTRMDLNITLM